ncbi:hypothetical protein SpCBS45565_g00927 [Spizellomyces sp. 'palustris']|nr:hypothetical protein SpCBS45565_g00927 [Spizellomyces sp. 'palustris']
MSAGNILSRMDLRGKIRALPIRQTSHQLLSVLLVLSTAMMIWKGLALLTQTESPIVVVLSESMHPAFNRGDLLLLTNPHPIHVGDIVVFKIDSKPIPVVHRVIQLHQNATHDLVLTKGDNNPVDDRGGEIYPIGKIWVERHEVVGRVRGFVPFLGLLTIWVNAYPVVKVGLVVGLILGALLSKTESK